MNTPSVKRQRQRQGPIGMHCDAPKSVPDPFPSVNPSVKTSKLPLGLFTPLSPNQLEQYIVDLQTVAGLKIRVRYGISILLLLISSYKDICTVCTLCPSHHYPSLSVADPRGAPPTDQNILNFMEFLGKSGKFVCWSPPGGLAPPSAGNLGSAPVCCQGKYVISHLQGLFHLFHRIHH